MLRAFLLAVLNRLFGSERADENTLIAYGREQERKLLHPEAIYLVNLACYLHGEPVALVQIAMGEWICPHCKAVPVPSETRTEALVHPVPKDARIASQIRTQKLPRLYQGH